MPVPQATLIRVAKLQPDATATNGIRVIVGGDGTRFFLIKDANQLWGLWQGTSAGIEPMYVPLPGIKHGDCDAVIPWDGTMVVYALSRVRVGDKDFHPLHHIELSAPQFRVSVSRAHLDGVYTQIGVFRQQIGALDAEIAVLEKKIASQGDGSDTAALEGRVTALEGVRVKVREALGD
jgi:hypothetical protein